MKLIVEKKGVFDKDGQPVEIGTAITVDGNAIPAWLAGKVSAPSVSKDAKLVTGQDDKSKAPKE